ncbi:MAG TPA: C4-dicarboxylate ABC transporter, partial [Telluria sp.]
RSVAPKEVKTSDIYWGAIPFVVIQVIMVALIILFPSLVSVDKKVDMTEQLELKIDAPAMEETPMQLPADGPQDPNKADQDSTPELNFSTDTEKK